MDWENVYTTGTFPSQRHVCGCGVISDEYLLVFGGYGDKGNYMCDGYKLNLFTKEWKQLHFPNSKEILGVHSFSTVIRGKSMFAFGGVKYKGINSNDMIEISAGCKFIS